MIICITRKDGRVYTGYKLEVELDYLVLTILSNNRLILINNKDVENVEVS